MKLLGYAAILAGGAGVVSRAAFYVKDSQTAATGATPAGPSSSSTWSMALYNLDPPQYFGMPYSGKVLDSGMLIDAALLAFGIWCVTRG